MLIHNLQILKKKEVVENHDCLCAEKTWYFKGKGVEEYKIVGEIILSDFNPFSSNMIFLHLKIKFIY